MQIQFPVYVLEKDDASVFRVDSESGIGYFEAIDVENHEYEAWDATGRRIELVAEDLSLMNAGHVVLKPTEKFMPLDVLEQLSWRARRI
jgi:hypothetical protein